MNVFEIAVGLAIVVATFASVTSTFVMPRSKPGRLRVAILVNRAVRLLGVGLSRFAPSYQQKDSVLAIVAPASLLAQLAMFLALFLAGYTIALVPYAPSIGTALEVAASSLFTATLAHVHAAGDAPVEVLAAVTGAVAVALQIGYLPAIYQAFNRREALVTLLESKAGLPAWGPELLIRHQLIASLDALGDLYRDWELWSADLGESHVSYPILLFFRSPEPGYSFVLALLAVLDAAALHLSLMPSSASSHARFCLRMGFTALRRIASAMGWTYDPDPDPDSDILLTFEEFGFAVEQMAVAGLPLERSAEEAWPQFRGWRVNYEAIAYRLADRVVAPPAPWSGERRHLAEDVPMPERPPHRSPGGKSIEAARHRPPT